MGASALPFSCLTSLCRRVQFCELKDFSKAAPFSDNLTHNRKVTKADERRFKSQTGKTPGDYQIGRMV
jgi:hypothetical protein